MSDELSRDELAEMLDEMVEEGLVEVVPSTDPPQYRATQKGARYVLIEQARQSMN